MEMKDLTKMKRSGTTVFAAANEVSVYRKAGFVLVEDSENEENKRTFSRLKVDELKALANLLNIDVSGMNAKAIKEAIKETETDEETLQTLIDALD